VHVRADLLEQLVDREAAASAAHPCCVSLLLGIARGRRLFLDFCARPCVLLFRQERDVGMGWLVARWNRGVVSWSRVVGGRGRGRSSLRRSRRRRRRAGRAHGVLKLRRPPSPSSPRWSSAAAPAAKLRRLRGQCRPSRPLGASAARGAPLVQARASSPSAWARARAAAAASEDGGGERPGAAAAAAAAVVLAAC
jgi:hypothetical protein